jgi:hypothetical protein
MSENSELRPLLFNGRLNIVTSAYATGTFPNRKFLVTNSDFLDSLDGRSIFDAQTGDVFIDSERYRFTFQDFNFPNFVLAEQPWSDTVSFDYFNVAGGNGILFRETPNCDFFQFSLETNGLLESQVHYMDHKIVYQVDEATCGTGALDAKNFLGDLSMTGVSGSTGTLSGMPRPPQNGDEWIDPITGESYIFKNNIWYAAPCCFNVVAVPNSDLLEVTNLNIFLVTAPTGPTGCYVFCKTGETAGEWVLDAADSTKTFLFNALGGTSVEIGNLATITYNGNVEANTLLCEQWQYSNEVFNNVFQPSLAADPYGNIFLSGGQDINTGPHFIDRKNQSTFGRAGPQIFIRKLDKQGLWNFYANIGVSGTNLYSSSLATNSCGDIYIATEISGNIQPVFQSQNAAILNTSTLGTGSESQILVAKLSNRGQWQWVARIDAATSNELAPSITVDAQDNAYVAGYGASGAAPIFYNFDGTVGQSGRAGQADQIFIGKINQFGNWIWDVSVDGLQTSNEINPAIVNETCDSIYMAAQGAANSTPFFYNRDANFGFTGLTGVSSGSGSQIIVAKLSKEGFWDWSAAIDAPTTNEINPSVATDAEGNLYVSGEGAQGTVPSYINQDGTVGLTGITGSNSQVFMGKINGNGFWQWQVAVDSSANERLSKVRIDKCGYVYLSGVGSNVAPVFYGINKTPVLIGGTGTNPHIFIGKIDSDGDWQWRNRIDLSGTATSYDMVGDSLGNLYVAGELSVGSTAGFVNRDDYKFLSSDSDNSGKGIFLGKLADDSMNAKVIGMVQNVIPFGVSDKLLEITFSGMVNYPLATLTQGANYYIECGTGMNVTASLTDQECDPDSNACGRRFVGVACDVNSLIWNVI